MHHSSHKKEDSRLRPTYANNEHYQIYVKRACSQAHLVEARCKCWSLTTIRNCIKIWGSSNARGGFRSFMWNNERPSSILQSSIVRLQKTYQGDVYPAQHRRHRDEAKSAMKAACIHTLRNKNIPKPPVLGDTCDLRSAQTSDDVISTE